MQRNARRFRFDNFATENVPLESETFITVPSLCRFHLTVDRTESVVQLVGPKHLAPTKKQNVYLTSVESLSNLRMNSYCPLQKRQED